MILNLKDNSNFETLGEKISVILDIVLIIAVVIALIASLFLHDSIANIVLGALSFLGTIPVAISALKDLIKKKLSVDLLASIALIFSLISHEWFSGAFITLMLAFARIFDHITEARAKKVIKSLMKYHVERVRLKVGDTVKEIHIREVKKGDEVVVETGDRMPVDGVVISGEAEIDESSLTGESELVHKKAGSKVFTSTVNESGSLIVRTEKVGKDTTLSRMVSLVEEASRSKNQAERSADRFTQWYISLSFIATIIMYFINIPPKVILSILLVVCADDIAVAVPLAFTAAISHAARRGVIVKGSSAFEQLSRIKFLLTDKTGTMTKGKPKVIDIKTYSEKYSINEVLKRFVIGATESRHAVSLAITEYGEKNNIKPHIAQQFSEIPGQGISFIHDGENMLLGRLSFMENKKCHIKEEIKKDIIMEKDRGRGIVCLALNGEVIGLISYQDELRPHAKNIIEETHALGVREWHMLTGDNEKVAAEVSKELGLRHYHANLTPEGKVEFIKKFEREHSGKGKYKGVVCYMGDGVNDAASLALADVSIAMGGIGADSAIEAADITIMKDQLERLPETVLISKKVMSIMKQNFGIWAITNALGLLLVTVGILGPAGAATYNFLTDFIPIGNALRAGRK